MRQWRLLAAKRRLIEWLRTIMSALGCGGSADIRDTREIDAQVESIIQVSQSVSASE